VLLRHSPPGFSSSIAYTYAITRRTRDSDEKHFFKRGACFKTSMFEVAEMGLCFWCRMQIYAEIDSAEVRK
jgi:hypothetical protein